MYQHVVLEEGAPYAAPHERSLVKYHLNLSTDNLELAQRIICNVLLANLDSIIFSPIQSSDYFELAQTTNTLLILSTMIFHDCIVVKGLIVPGCFNMKSPDGISYIANMQGISKWINNLICSQPQWFCKVVVLAGTNSGKFRQTDRLRSSVGWHYFIQAYLVQLIDSMVQ